MTMTEEQKRALRARKNRRNLIWMAIAAGFIFLAALGIVYSQSIIGGLVAVWQAVLPLLVGFILAFVLNLVMVKLERVFFPNSRKAVVRRLRRPVCLILSVAFFALVIAAIVNLILPELRTSIAVAEQGIVTIFRALYDWVAENPNISSDLLHQLGIPDIEKDLSNFVAGISTGDLNKISGLATYLVSAAGSIAHVVFSVIVSIVFSIYTLLEKERVLKGAESLLEMLFPEKRADFIRHAASVANESFSKFVTGQFLEAVIVGVLCTIGMTAMGMPYAVSVGVCVGVMALVPVFGAWLGGIVGFLMVLTAGLSQAIGFAIFLLILQQLESHLIYPNVVGSMVELPSIWVFSGVLVGGTLFGVFGMLLGVPTIATARILVMEHIEKVRADRSREAAMPGPVAIGDPTDSGGFGGFSF